MSLSPSSDVLHKARQRSVETRAASAPAAAVPAPAPKQSSSFLGRIFCCVRSNEAVAEKAKDAAAKTDVTAASVVGKAPQETTNYRKDFEALVWKTEFRGDDKKISCIWRLFQTVYFFFAHQYPYLNHSNVDMKAVFNFYNNTKRKDIENLREKEAKADGAKDGKTSAAGAVANPLFSGTCQTTGAPKDEGKIT